MSSPQSSSCPYAIGQALPGDSDTGASWSDYELMHAIASAEQEQAAAGLHTLYQRHGPALLAYLTGQLDDPQLAEEVLQDVMLAVWRGAPGFRGDSKVTTWLLAIARRRAITARQRRPPANTSLSDTDTGATLASAGPGPLETVEQHTTAAAVRAALRQLPADQRETLELVFYHGLSGPEAAEVLGVAHGTVKSRLHRAKAQLSHLLRGHHEDSHDA